MSLKLLGIDPSSSGGSSPTIWQDGDDFVIQGWRVEDSATLFEVGEVPAHETIIRIPARMLRFFPSGERT